MDDKLDRQEYVIKIKPRKIIFQEGNNTIYSIVNRAKILNRNKWKLFFCILYLHFHKAIKKIPIKMNAVIKKMLILIIVSVEQLHTCYLQKKLSPNNSWIKQGCWGTSLTRIFVIISSMAPITPFLS